ncbi:hypothetical protein RJ640_013653 [Escallonia rubra]|uniref:Uncharacterized protein n=1 Tax=Escallonia rubra TaxID=112253 RepID=A0AA88UBW0_9ASTE|nr:hypothetical protein RJ640_013653 [Escallonia rubra]
MAVVPLRFKRITAAFDDLARARLCESSGSEHSAAESSAADLSDLVDSFLEREGNEVELGHDEHEEETDKKKKKTKKKKKKKSSDGEEGVEPERCSFDSEAKEVLMSLVGGGEAEEEGEDGRVKRMVCAEVEKAWRSLLDEGAAAEGYKRRVMTSLRQRGFDAGLCKSRWEKTASCPAGDYEYVDIIASETRYIVEVSLVTEFTIARPTKNYRSLLQSFPQVLVCKESELKQAVRVMCFAMRESLKKRDMHVPPWRRNGYMQSKWFGSYKRTTNAVSPKEAKRGVDDLAGKILVGFESPAGDYRHCRGEMFVDKHAAVAYLRLKGGTRICAAKWNQTIKLAICTLLGFDSRE